MQYINRASLLSLGNVTQAKNGRCKNMQLSSEFAPTSFGTRRKGLAEAIFAGLVGTLVSAQVTLHKFPCSILTPARTFSCSKRAVLLVVCPIRLLRQASTPASALAGGRVAHMPAINSFLVLRKLGQTKLDMAVSLGEKVKSSSRSWSLQAQSTRGKTNQSQYTSP